jgi:hypothetical protein
MTATKIDGTAIAKNIRERLGEQIKSRQESNPRYRPSLKIVQGKSGHGSIDNDGMLIDVQLGTGPTRVCSAAHPVTWYT